jgi:hypothetical protein
MTTIWPSRLANVSSENIMTWSLTSPRRTRIRSFSTDESFPSCASSALNALMIRMPENAASRRLFVSETLCCDASM